MTVSRLPLTAAFVASLLLHALALLPEWLAEKPPPRPPPLLANLQPHSAAPATPELRLATPSLSEKPAVPHLPAKPQEKRPAAENDWRHALRQQIMKQQQAGLFYSRESIAARLEGEVLVFFILDRNGNVDAARVEESSGQPLLDRDAVAAIRRLKGLPADAPRQVLLPVVFRLERK